jgi:hypothetical protein
MNEHVQIPSSYRKVQTVLVPTKEINTVDEFNGEFLFVKPLDLFIDGKYQRDLTDKSKKLIRHIIRNWDWKKFKPPIVARDEHGLYVIIDGQHTSIAAASNPFIKQIPICLVPMETQEHRAESFVGHNVDRISVTGIDKFRAKLEAGDEDAISINMALNNSGVLLRPPHLCTDTSASYVCFVDLLYTLNNKYGLQVLRRSLSICKKAQLHIIPNYMLRAVADCLTYSKFKYKMDDNALILCLSDYPTADFILHVESRAIKNKHVNSKHRIEGTLDKTDTPSVTKPIIARNILIETYLAKFGEPHP